DLSGVAMLGSGQGTIRALAGMQAQLAAALRLGLPPIPAAQLQAVARLEAMAMVSAALGVKPLHPGAPASTAPSISSAIGSANVHLPAILSELMAALADVLADLANLLQLESAVQAVRVGLGVDLASAGAVARLAATAQASLSAAVSAGAGSLQALVGYARLV